MIELGRARLRDNQLDSAVVELGQAHELVRHPADRAAVAIDLGRALGQRAYEAIVVLDRAAQELPDGHPELDVTIEMEIAVASHIGPPGEDGRPAWQPRSAGPEGPRWPTGRCELLRLRSGINGIARRQRGRASRPGRAWRTRTRVTRP